MVKDRVPISTRISRELYRSWGRYCETSRGWGYKGELTENALTEYMVNHPNEQNVIIINGINSDTSDIQRQLEEDLLSSDIFAYIEVLDRLRREGGGYPNEFKEELHKVVSKAVKIKGIGERLKAALQRVKDGGYFD